MLHWRGNVGNKKAKKISVQALEIIDPDAKKRINVFKSIKNFL
jgi:hypothetical protein